MENGELTGKTVDFNQSTCSAKHYSTELVPWPKFSCCAKLILVYIM